MKLIKNLGHLLPLPTSKQTKLYGIYKCNFCNVEFKVQTAKVKAGQKQCNSCARKRGRKHYTHGMTNTKLFSVFNGMLTRCYNKKSKSYSNYGERGVTVCSDWLDNKELFFSWALSNGYEVGLTIDRIESEGGYNPQNCRWVNLKAQAQNRRKLDGCSSKYAGVRKQPWGYESRVMLDGKRTQIGCFDSEYDAALARDRFILDSGNKYAKLNILKR